MHIFYCILWQNTCKASTFECATYLIIYIDTASCSVFAKVYFDLNEWTLIEISVTDYENAKID